MRIKNHCGFTLVEALTTAAALSVLLSVAFIVIKHVVGDTRDQKLATDLRTLNSAVRAYITSGGAIAPSATGTDILAKLKTTTTDSDAERHIGLSNSLVDPRLVGVPQTSEEQAAGELRVVWDPGSLSFQLTDSGTGFSRFDFDPALATTPPVTETRTSPRRYSVTDPWVWDYQELPVAESELSEPIPTGGTYTPVPPTINPPTKQVLQPPVFSQPSLTAPVTQFDIQVTLTDPNPPGLSRILYTLDGLSWDVSDGSPIGVPPNSFLEAVAATIAPDEWIDSGYRYETYNATSVSTDDTVTTPETEGTLIDVTGNDHLAPLDPLVSPVEAIDGVALQPGYPAEIASGATVTLLSDGSIYYDPNGEFLELAAGETAEDTFTYTLANGTTSTVTVTVAGVTQNLARDRAYLGQDAPSGLYHVEIDPASEALTFADQILSGHTYNAMGYNDADDQIYAWTRTGFNGLVRIDPLTGTITDLGTVSGVPNQWHWSGTVAPDGFYYLQKARNLYKIDIASRTVARHITLSESINIHDIAWDPGTDLFFSIEKNSNDIITIDPADGSVTSFPQSLGLNKAWGAVYTDARGNVFGVNNAGGLYYVEKSTMTLRYLTGSPDSGNNDGAHSKAVVSSLARPHVFLDPDGSGLAKNGFYTRYELGADPVPVADDDLKLVHLLGRNLTSATVTLSNAQTGDTLSLSEPVAGIHHTFSGNQLALAGNATVADYQQALRNLRFANADPDAPLSPPRVATLNVYDAEGNPSADVKSIIFVVRPSGGGQVAGL